MQIGWKPGGTAARGQGTRLPAALSGQRSRCKTVKRRSRTVQEMLATRGHARSDREKTRIARLSRGNGFPDTRRESSNHTTVHERALTVPRLSDDNKTHAHARAHRETLPVRDVSARKKLVWTSEPKLVINRISLTDFCRCDVEGFSRPAIRLRAM